MYDTTSQYCQPYGDGDYYVTFQFSNTEYGPILTLRGYPYVPWQFATKDISTETARRLADLYGPPRIPELDFYRPVRCKGFSATFMRIAYREQTEKTEREADVRWHRLKEQRSLEQITAWLEAGGDVNTLAINIYGSSTRESLISICSRFNLADIVRALIDRGADPHAGDLSALNLTNSSVCVHLLVEHGADVNRRVYHGNTEFMSAVERILLYRIKLYLDHGADVNARNDEGMTALDIVDGYQMGYLGCLNERERIEAEREWHDDTREIAELLIAAGAKRGSELDADV